MLVTLSELGDESAAFCAHTSDGAIVSISFMIIREQFISLAKRAILAKSMSQN